MVEIDRGTMPVTRSSPAQTSFERKMRAYLDAHAARLHQRHFGWKAFRVLTVTTDAGRQENMREALSRLHVATAPDRRCSFSPPGANSGRAPRFCTLGATAPGAPSPSFDKRLLPHALSLD